MIFIMNVERRNSENARFAWNWAACFINLYLSPKVNWTGSENRQDQDWMNCFLPQKKLPKKRAMTWVTIINPDIRRAWKTERGGDRPKACVNAACGAIGPRARKPGDTGVCAEGVKISERRSIASSNARIAKNNCYY